MFPNVIIADELRIFPPPLPRIKKQKTFYSYLQNAVFETKHISIRAW